MWKKQAIDYMDARKLVPNNVIIGVVKERLCHAGLQGIGLAP
jgi:hypothetical protein